MAGRPAPKNIVYPEIRRTKPITTYLSEAEHDILVSNAIELNLSNAAYARILLLDILTPKE